MFSMLVTLTLVIGAHPTLPILPKVEMPKLADGPAPIKPLSSQTPLRLPVMSPLTVSSQQSLNLPARRRASLDTTPTVPLFSPSTALQPTVRSKVVPNGCGSETSFFNPNRVPQSFAGANFGKACDAHDICYGTLWANKIACDNRFVLDLYRSCLTTPGMSRATPMCLGLSTAYYAAVRFGGSSAFQQAQIQALMPAQSGPSLFGSPAPFTEKFSLLPKANPSPKYRLADVDLFKEVKKPIAPQSGTRKIKSR